MSWLSNWSYRKKITIQGQSGAGIDYQVLLKVGESSGASGCDFHVEGHSANFPNADDNFDDNLLNDYLWKKIINGNNVSVEEQNGRIEASVTATSGTNYGLLKSKFYLSGDFDIQIDFSNLDLESKEFGFIRLAISIDANNYAYCQREYRNSYGHNYFAGIKVNDSETDGHVATTDTAGKLRITREGKTLTCYYWDGSNWQQIHQRTDFPTNDVFISICEIYSSANHPQISAYFDNFKINKGTVLKPSSGDLRFTKNDGTTLLSFWVEKVEGTSPNRVAYCWVKINDNLDNNVDIYCYYGNSNATNVSNGDDTFIFFDDFNGSSLDTNKWNELNTGPLTINSSILTIKSDADDTSHDVYSKDTFSYDHCLRGRIAIKPKTCFALENSQHTESVLEWYDASEKWRFANKTGGTLYQIEIGDADVGAWHIDEIIYKSDKGKLRRDGSDITSQSSGVPNIALPVNIRSWSATNDIRCDWVLVRKYIDPEPSYSLAGSEEILEEYETRNYNYQFDSYLIHCIDSSLSLDSLLYPFQRKLVRKSDGSFIAVYHKEVDDIYQIFLASSNDGIVWSSTQVTNDSYHQKYPAIIIDAEDDVHLVWLSQVDSDTYKIAYKCQLSGQWQDTEVIGDAIENSAPTIVFTNENDDIIYVSWHKDNKIFVKKKINNTWQSSYEFSTGVEQLFPCITVDNNGKFHLVWSIKKTSDGLYRIVYLNEEKLTYFGESEFGESEFGAQIEELAEVEGNNYPIILIDLNNNIYVYWRDKGYGNNPNYYNIVYRKNDGSGWTNIQNVSDEDHNQLAPSISATIQNDIYAVWSGLGWPNNPTFYNVQYRKPNQSVQSVTDVDRHQWFPNTIYSLYPKVFGTHTNVPKQGFGFIWLDDIYLKFYNFNLDWQSAIWKYYWIDVLLVNKVNNFLDILLQKSFDLNYSLDLLLEKHVGYIIKQDVINENLKSQRRLIRKDNNLYCVYIYNNQLYLATSNDNGQTWAEEQITNESNPQSEPDIAIDSEGYIHIVWVNNSNIYYIRKIEAGFNTPIQITSNGDQHSPVIIIDKNDNGYIAWYGKSNNIYNIYIAYLNTTTGQITSTEQITNDNFYDQINPILAIDDSYLHLIWTGKGYGSNPNFYNLQYKRKALDGDWYPQESITDKPYDQDFPSAIADLDGNLNVVWQGKGWGNNPNVWNIIFRKRTSATSVWEDEEIITNKAEDQIQPSISTDSYSNINVVWTGKAWGLFTNHFNIQYKQKTASTWSSIKHITDTSNDHYWPTFISSIYPIIDEVHTNIPKAGYAFTWIDKDTLRYYPSSDLEWKIPENKFLIAQNVHYYLGYHCLARDSNGKLWVTYSKKIGSYYHIFIAYSEDNGKTWTEEQITSGNRHQKYSSIAIDSLNNVHLIYLDYINDYSVYYKKRNALGNWETEELVDEQTFEEFNYLDIAVDSQDNVHVVWKKYDAISNATYIAYRRKIGSSWQSIEEATSKHLYDDYPTIAIDNDDNIHLVFIGKYGPEDNANVQYKKRDNNGWNARIALEYENWDSENCSICLDDDGNIYVSWDNGLNIWARSYINNEWKDKCKLTNLLGGGAAQSYLSTISSTKNGKIHLIYIDMQEDPFREREYHHFQKDVGTTEWSDSEFVLDLYSYYEGIPRLIWANWPQLSGIKPNRPYSGYAFVYHNRVDKDLWFYRSSDLKWDSLITPTERMALFYNDCCLLKEFSSHYQIDSLNLKEKIYQYNIDIYLCLAKLLEIEVLLFKQLSKSYDIDLKFIGMKKLNISVYLGKTNVLEHDIDMFIIKDGVIFSDTLLEGKANYGYFLNILIQKLNKTLDYQEDVLLKDKKNTTLNIDTILKPTRSFNLDILLKGFKIDQNYPVDMCISDTYTLQFNFDSILSILSNKPYSVDLLIPASNFSLISIDVIISNKFAKSFSLSNSLVHNFKSSVLLPFLLDLRNILINELLSRKFKGFYLRNSIANIDISKSLSLLNSYEKFATNQSLINELPELLNKILYLLNTITDINIENRQFIVNSLQQLAKTNQLQNELGDAFSSMLAVLNDLIQPINKIETVSSDIIDYLAANQSLINELSYLYPSETGEEEICTRFLEYNDWDIKLDGISIKDKVIKIDVYRRESEIFNHIELTIVDPKLFKQCDPYYNSGLERIELKISNKTMKFLLESREGSEESREFNIWGRCKAAILSEPFSISTNYVIKDKKASEIAQELAGSINVDWQIYDYYVKEFTYQGYPIDGISRLAEVIGGVVRTKSDGSLLVRYKFPIRPKDLQDADAVYELDRYSNLVSLDYNEEAALYDSVEVRGADYSEMESYFSIETDKTCFEIGKEDAILKVYKYPFDIDYTVFSTDGTITKISSNKTEEVTENINIENESGNTSKYVYDLISHEWIGGIKKKNEKEPLGTIEFDRTNVQCSNCAGGYLRINYKTLYDEWKLTCNKETEVKSIVIVPEGETIVLNVVIGDGNRPASPIQDELINEEYMAVLRGQAFLDDNYYQKIKHTVKLPYVDIEDGQVVSLADDYYNLYGKYLVKQSDISITLEEDTLKVWLTLNIEKYRKVL